MKDLSKTSFLGKYWFGRLNKLMRTEAGIQRFFQNEEPEISIVL